jgi:hypothetical protein
MEHIAEEYKFKNEFHDRHVCKEDTSNAYYFSDKISDNIFYNVNKYSHEEYQYYSNYKRTLLMKQLKLR